uniref:Uncharacterized protein n=1 Tax=Setaria italica TaxID=4555 RepID=K4ANJ6_SETIT
MKAVLYFRKQANAIQIMFLSHPCLMSYAIIMHASFKICWELYLYPVETELQREW